MENILASGRTSHVPRRKTKKIFTRVRVVHCTYKLISLPYPWKSSRDVVSKFLQNIQVILEGTQLHWINGAKGLRLLRELPDIFTRA